MNKKAIIKEMADFDKLSSLKLTLHEADKVKNRVSTLYSDAMEMTFPSGNAFHGICNANINSKDASTVIYNDLTIEASETLANQMELALTRAGDEWAAYSVEDPIGNQEDAITLRDKTKEIFEKIHASNFQKQISPIYRDLIIGTGCLKLSVSGKGKKKKLVYKHLNLGRCYFLENGEGDVDTTFYKIEGFTIPKIERMLGTKVLLSKEKRKEFYDDDVPKEFNLFECAIPKGGDTWEFMITDEGFNTVFYSKILKYNPYIVARFNKRNDISVWGVGKAIERLSLIKSLQFSSKNREAVILRDSNPSYIVTTSNLKQPDLNFDPNSYNFFPMGTTVTPMFSNIDLQKLSFIISEKEAKLKQAFLIDSILEAQAQNTYKTATEINTANQKFLDKFSTYASAIADELPRQIFERTFALLQEEGMVKKLKAKISKKLFYVNPITIGQKAKEVDKIVQIAQIGIGLVGQENFVAELKAADVMPWLVHHLSGDPKLFNTKEEAQGVREQIGEAKAVQDGSAPQEEVPQEGAPVEQQMSAGGGQIESEDLGVV